MKIVRSFTILYKSAFKLRRLKLRICIFIFNYHYYYYNKKLKLKMFDKTKNLVIIICNLVAIIQIVVKTW